MPSVGAAAFDTLREEVEPFTSLKRHLGVKNEVDFVEAFPKLSAEKQIEVAHDLFVAMSRVAHLLAPTPSSGNSQQLLIPSPKFAQFTFGDPCAVAPAIDVDTQSVSDVASMMDQTPRSTTNARMVVTTSFGAFASRGDGFEVLNDYTILDELGRGAHSTVLLAIHAKTEEPYAIKSVQAKSSKRYCDAPTPHNLAYGKNSNREIAIMKRLRHPNIVSLHEVISDVDEGRLYLIMDYIPNGPVVKFDENHRCRPLPLETVKRYAGQIADGLAYLHRKHVVHNDVKPDNMLVGNEGRVYLSDFGVSDILKQGGVGSSLSSRGTPAFFAPEVCRGEDTGPAADVWSFGVSIFAMLFGFLPFLADTVKETTELIQTEDPPFPTDADPTWKDVLSKLLDRIPETRMTLRQFKHSAVFANPLPTDTAVKLLSPVNPLTVEAATPPVVAKQLDTAKEAEDMGGLFSPPMVERVSPTISTETETDDDTRAGSPTEIDLLAAVTPRNDTRVAFFNERRCSAIMRRRMTLGFADALGPLVPEQQPPAAPLDLTQKPNRAMARRGTLIS